MADGSAAYPVADPGGCAPYPAGIPGGAVAEADPAAPSVGGIIPGIIPGGPVMPGASAIPGAAAPPDAEASGGVAVAAVSSPPPQPATLIARAGNPIRNAVPDRKNIRKEGTGVSDQKPLSCAEQTLRQICFLRVSDGHSSQAERKQLKIRLQAAAISPVQNRLGILDRIGNHP